MTAENLREKIRSLEEKLLEPAVRASSRELDALLAEDFIEFGSSGRTFDKREVIRHLHDAPPFEATLDDFALTDLGGDSVLVTYRLDVRSLEPPVSTSSLRSSVWVRRDDRWQLLFHQGTAVEPC